MLLGPGTSLGGARPKASVIDPEGNLWVAKFPSNNDETDVGAWEGLVTQLAGAAGLRTACCRTEAFSGAGGSACTLPRLCACWAIGMAMEQKQVPAIWIWWI